MREKLYAECVIELENYAKYINYIIENDSFFDISKYNNMIDYFNYVKNNFNNNKNVNLINYVDYLTENIEKSPKWTRIIRKVKLKKIMNYNVTKN